MSAVIHYSEAPDGTIPKTFLCGKKCKGGNEWTRYQMVVECPRCLVKMSQIDSCGAAERNANDH